VSTSNIRRDTPLTFNKRSAQVFIAGNIAVPPERSQP
jgi:hypothetical protein